jgi:hypothetical protein
MLLRTGILIGFLVNNNRGLFRLFFISVDFKGSYRSFYRTPAMVRLFQKLREKK